MFSDENKKKKDKFESLKLMLHKLSDLESKLEN